MGLVQREGRGAEERGRKDGSTARWSGEPCGEEGVMVVVMMEEVIWLPVDTRLKGGSRQMKEWMCMQNSHVTCRSGRCFRRIWDCVLKVIVHPKMKVILSFTHPEFVPNLYDSAEYNDNNNTGLHLLSLYGHKCTKKMFCVLQKHLFWVNYPFKGIFTWFAFGLQWECNGPLWLSDKCCRRVILWDFSKKVLYSVNVQYLNLEQKNVDCFNTLQKERTRTMGSWNFTVLGWL